MNTTLLIVALIVISILAAILLSIVIYGAEKLYQMKRVETALKRAWFDQGECQGDECAEQIRSLTLPPEIAQGGIFDPVLALKLGDYLSRISIATKYQKHTGVPTPVQHPEDSEALHILPATDHKGPPFGVLYRIKGTRTLVLAFRSTATPAEVGRDLDLAQKGYPDPLGDAKVHQGFLKTWEDHRDLVMQCVADEDPEQIYVTGHSLGAAVATLASFELAQLHTVECYQFGCPRVGNPEFDTLIRAQPRLTLWRVVNATDIIAMLPPEVTPNITDEAVSNWIYKHAGQSYEFSRNYHSWKYNHVLENYLREMERLAELNTSSTSSTERGLVG